MNDLQARQMVLWLLGRAGGRMARRDFRQHGKIVQQAADYLILTGAVDYRHGELRLSKPQ